MSVVCGMYCATTEQWVAGCGIASQCALRHHSVGAGLPGLSSLPSRFFLAMCTTSLLAPAENVVEEVATKAGHAQAGEWQKKS